MRVPSCPIRPSLFAIVSLLVLLAMGVAANVYIAHKPSPNYPRQTIRDNRFVTESPSPSDPVHWPSIPDEVIENIGQPNHWILYEYLWHRRIEIQWNAQIESTGMWHSMAQRRIGFPFVTRSTTRLGTRDMTAGLPMAPMQGITSQSSTTTYQPLGLIVNPIIYALPPWGLLLLLRYELRYRRTARRIDKGLCPRCAYDIQDLPTCPECGHATPEHTHTHAK